ncbi:MAG: hypothetical protein ACI31M_00025 [Bacilli bacterium]
MANFKGVLNNVGNLVNNSVTKMVQNIPLEYAYIGYKVSKGLVIENTNINGVQYRDLYLNTYLSIDPVVIVLMEDGNYKDFETGLKAPKLEYGYLVSKHLARGNNINIANYPSYSKSNVLGYFNLKKFEDVVKAVIEIENSTSVISLNNTTLKNSYTFSQMNIILKKYLNKKNDNSLIKTFVVPPVLIDELDDIRTVYTLESKFLYEYYGKSDEEIFNDIKQKSEEYESIKNSN